MLGPFLTTYHHSRILPLFSTDVGTSFPTLSYNSTPRGFSGKTKQPRAVPACMCVHTCVCLHRTRANTSAGTQKLCCGPRSRREEGELTVQAWGLLLASESSNLKGAASEAPLDAFLSFPSLSFGKPGWVICQLYPCKDFAPEKEKSINSR